MKRLTEKSYWDNIYSHANEELPLKLDGIKNRANRLIFEKLLELNLEKKKILEIGAGNSLWLPFIAERFPSSHCAGIDYSESGCTLLAERARIASVDVKVIHEDIFVERSEFHKSFDIVFSLGVVEHFGSLNEVLSAKKKYLAPGGAMFTLIPNMAGVMGALARRWNLSVYEKHNPHDLVSFLRGHHESGLTVSSSGYLDAIDFGVLASCFPDRAGLPFQMHRALVAASLAIGILEDKIRRLPAGRLFSSYIYALSH